jgi:hypothetical protein
VNQSVLFDEENDNKKVYRTISLGGGLILKIFEGVSPTATLLRFDIPIKEISLSDKVDKRLLVVEAVEQGAKKSVLASTLNISRQTIHNYVESKKHFGIEGLIKNYSYQKSKSKRKHREENADKGLCGNKAKQLTEIRKKAKEEQCQGTFRFSFEDGQKSLPIDINDQPFSKEHGWKNTRYAGVFLYIVTLVAESRWLELIIGLYGKSYKIFTVFLLMAARNIRSIEQVKNIRSHEAEVVPGIKHLPTKNYIWEWFYNAAKKGKARVLQMDYFRHQLVTGRVGIWLWFTDGHLLPYTGRKKVHSAYNTQRRMPVPGRTNMVTCDGTGRIVYFEIQEGKGDLRSHIKSLKEKWGRDIPETPIMVFDREGHVTEFFYDLVKSEIPFVTWEKYSDSKKLAEIEDSKFTSSFTFNSKEYAVFEDEKQLSYSPEGLSDTPPPHFNLRRIYIWNKTSKRRVSGLAWDGKKGMSTQECAQAILSRWGASENTFKHLKDKHPLHYHPGFKFVNSDKQEISNPEIKEKNESIKRIKKDLDKYYKKLSKTSESKTIDGKPRKNSVKERLSQNIRNLESELEKQKEEKHRLPERVDVTTLEGYSSFKRIDDEGKYLFDFVTSSVWNVRKQMVDWLRQFFDYENELIDLFYAITECHGWIKNSKKEVIVRLEPLQQPKRRLAQEQLCRKLSSLLARTPNGKWLQIEVGGSPL